MMKILILYDNIPENASEDEQDVVIQCKSVSEALSGIGHETVCLSFSLDFDKLLDEFNKIAPDMVFNLVESVNGQGNLIHIAASFLDKIKMPYTGSKTEALFSTSNKLIAKRMLKSSGISTPEWFSLDYENIFNGKRYYIIKSIWEHASKGISQNSIFYAESKENLIDRIKYQHDIDRWNCFAEAYIEGREFNISMLDSANGPQVLPHAEIVFIDYPDESFKIIDYSAKWKKDTFEYQHTFRNFDFNDSDIDLLKQLSKICLDCWSLFELRGYARVDFRVDKYGNPWVLEINSNPCIAPDSGFIAAAQHAGLSFEKVIERITLAAFQ